MREPAHGLGEWPRAMARRGRLLPDLRISAPSVVARILAWARDATDFRPSINGVGGACASRRTVCESGRERWRGGAGVYPTSGFRPTHHNTRPTCALTECNSHLFTLTRPLGDGSAFLEGRIRTPACAHVPHAMQCKHRTVHVHLEERFSTLCIEGRGDPWRGGSEHGTSDERSRRLSDTLTAIPGAC